MMVFVFASAAVSWSARLNLLWHWVAEVELDLAWEQYFPPSLESGLAMETV